MKSFKLLAIFILFVSEPIFIQSAPHQKWPILDEHQSNACILICSECLKDDLNKMDSETDALDYNSPVISCANQCIENENPLEKLLSSLSSNSLEDPVSDCIRNMIHIQSID